MDGGANIGLFSRILLNINPQIKGIAFEVEKGNAVIAKKNLAPFEGVVVRNCALWNEDCKIKIIERNNGSKLSFMVEKTDDDNGIDAVSVSEIINCPVDIFKIDIEGSEWEVFDEQSDTWIEKEKIFIIEI